MTQVDGPANQARPSTSTRAPAGGHVEVAGPGPHVGEPAQPPLEPAVGVADEQRVEAGAGHHREVLVVERCPTSMRRRRPLRPTATAPSMSRGIAEVDGQEVGGARPAGWRARVRLPTSAPSDGPDRAVAAPDEDQVGAASQRRRATRVATMRAFVTSCQIGSTTPAPCSTSRSSVRPPPNDLRTWATTATRVGRRLLSPCGACRSGARSAPPGRRCRRSSSCR